MRWPYHRIWSWEILMKWCTSGTQEEGEGGRQVQERNDHQTRVSLTCRELAARLLRVLPVARWGQWQRWKTWNSDLGLKNGGGEVKVTGAQGILGYSSTPNPGQEPRRSEGQSLLCLLWALHSTVPSSCPGMQKHFQLSTPGAP